MQGCFAEGGVVLRTLTSSGGRAGILGTSTVAPRSPRSPTSPTHGCSLSDRMSTYIHTLVITLAVAVALGHDWGSKSNKQKQKRLGCRTGPHELLRRTHTATEIIKTVVSGLCLLRCTRLHYIGVSVRHQFSTRSNVPSLPRYIMKTPVLCLCRLQTTQCSVFCKLPCFVNR